MARNITHNLVLWSEETHPVRRSVLLCLRCRTCSLNQRKDGGSGGRRGGRCCHGDAQRVDDSLNVMNVRVMPAQQRWVDRLKINIKMSLLLLLHLMKCVFLHSCYMRWDAWGCLWVIIFNQTYPIKQGEMDGWIDW